jgi:hypothetical protein
MVQPKTLIRIEGISGDISSGNVNILDQWVARGEMTLTAVHVVIWSYVPRNQKFCHPDPNYTASATYIKGQQIVSTMSLFGFT